MNSSLKETLRRKPEFPLNNFSAQNAKKDSLLKNIFKSVQMLLCWSILFCLDSSNSTQKTTGLPTVPERFRDSENFECQCTFCAQFVYFIFPDTSAIFSQISDTSAKWRLSWAVAAVCLSFMQKGFHDPKQFDCQFIYCDCFCLSSNFSETSACWTQENAAVYLSFFQKKFHEPTQFDCEKYFSCSPLILLLRNISMLSMTKLLNL